AEPRTPSPVRFRSGSLLLLASVLLSAMPLFVRGEIAAIGPGTASLLAVIGLALAGPRLAQWFTGLLARRLPARAPAALWLAVTNTRGYALRTAGAVAALGMVVTLATSMSLTHTTIMAATEAEAVRTVRADAAVTAPAYGGIPYGLLEEVRRTPGVRAAVSVSTTTVVSRSLAVGDGGESSVSRAALVLGPEAKSVVDLDVTGGDLADLTGASIALDERAGRVGERRELTLGDGTPVRVTVVATYTRALGVGPVVLARDLVAGHTTAGLDSTVLVRGEFRSGTLAARWPGVVVAPGGLSPQEAEGSAQLWINLAVLAVLLGYVLVSVAGRLVATTAGRGAEIAALKRLGATPRQLRAMIRWEALLIALTASGAGLVMSLAPVTLLSIGFLGRPWPSGPLWAAPAAVAVVCALVWPAYELTARRLIRRA
ncbi:FtsX-like permease family protein, partial [Nonomuraea longicatena]|uniref:FtsX-like permease family protein n=1 Tax=Nonomuraea longicatena TaxID=83682 RepID=UPI0031E469DE